MKKYCEKVLALANKYSEVDNIQGPSNFNRQNQNRFKVDIITDPGEEAVHKDIVEGEAVRESHQSCNLQLKEPGIIFVCFAVREPLPVRELIIFSQEVRIEAFLSAQRIDPTSRDTETQTTCDLFYLENPFKSKFSFKYSIILMLIVIQLFQFFSFT